MRIAYVCDGGGDLGWGHVSRGRALWEAGAAAVTLVLGRGLTEIGAWAERTNVSIPLAPWASADVPLSVSPRKYDVVIVDHYEVDVRWIQAMAEILPTLVVDDWMRSTVRATALLNHNLGAERDDYPTATVREWLLGPQYCLLRGEVRNAKAGVLTGGLARNVLMTLGGSDPQSRVADLAGAIVDLPWFTSGGRLTVVLGPSYRGPWPSSDWLKARGRVDVVRSPGDFAARCAAADLVVCSASTTTYELAYLGRPFIPVALVENQRRIATAWRERGVGSGALVWEDKWMEGVISEVERLTGDGTERATASGRVSRLVDGRGVDRVLEVCQTLHEDCRAA